MFNLRVFKPPYLKATFEHWANTCYNLLALSVTGIPVVLTSNSTAEYLKVIYAVGLVLASIVFLYYGLIFTNTAANIDKES